MQNQTQVATLTVTADDSQLIWQAPYRADCISEYKWLGGRWNPEMRAWVFTNPERGTRGRLLKLIGKRFPDYTYVKQQSEPAPEPAPAAQPTAPGMGRCSQCGDEVPAIVLMSSSVHGSVCPRCYDRVER